MSNLQDMQPTCHGSKVSWLRSKSLKLLLLQCSTGGSKDRGEGQAKADRGEGQAKAGD